MQPAQPYPGVPVKPSPVMPAPGMVIVGYQLVDPETGCCKCNDLTGGGMALLIVGILLFWPIALIPCFMADCKIKGQIPIYGYPGGAPPQAAAMPYPPQPAYPPQQGYPAQAPQ